MTDLILRVRGLSKRFGRVRALRGADFGLRRGLITAFLGENGAGKTTTLKLILGFMRPDSGRVEMTAQRIGYVPERPSFFPWLSGEDLIALTARLSGLKAEERRRRTERHAERIAFDAGLLVRKVPTYSLGNQKKFSYLQSLLGDPDFLIVDEPFSALDPRSISLVRDLFTEMRREGKTLLLSSHLISELEKVCDEFIIIRRGIIVLQESLNRLTRDYKLARLSREPLGRGMPPEPQLRAFSPWIKDQPGEILLLLDKTPAGLLAARYPDRATILPGPLDLEQIFFFFN
jgi:ABC-2 type transport system ATP-binding protein